MIQNIFTFSVLNDKFFAAPIGHETELVLNRLVVKIHKNLKELPFTARVVRAKGKQVYFDVGSISNVHVGDVFMTYRLTDDPLMDPFGQINLGFQETPVTSLVVKRVQPQFAIGELDLMNITLKAGDVVRFTW